MVKKKQLEHYISTHARIFLSDWRTLADLVNKHTKLVKESVQSEHNELEEESETKQEKKPVLTTRQINDALNGPYQRFFKDKMTAYAAISRMKLELNIIKNEIFKDKRQASPELSLPASQLEKFSMQDLHEIQNELNELTEKDNVEWETHLADWQQHIIEALKQYNISLNEIEIIEFQGKEPISELLERFTELNIQLPKTKKNGMNFAAYLTYKTNIAIHSALSRQHQPHEQTDINKILKSLKSVFDKITKEENNLIKKQQAATNAIIAPIAFAKFTD